LDAAEALGGIVTAWLLDPPALRGAAGLAPDEVSSTFHGRDVFAPAAALMAMGGDSSLVGSAIKPAGLVRLARPFVDSSAEGVVAEVVEVDRFGNVGLALGFAGLRPQEGSYSVEIAGEELPAWRARVVTTYGDLSPGELGIFCDSWGQLALALNEASAAQLLAIERGMKVRLTPISGITTQGPAV
jgi:hypothetical protein